MKIGLQWVLALALGLIAAEAEAAQQRIALVIGNGGYSYAPLDNPVADATDVAAKLRALHFDVVVLATDADQETLEKRIEEFGKRVHDGDLALFYYAGHAVQSTDKRNYLIPIGKKIPDKVKLKYHAVDVQEVLDYADKAQVKIVILDACRDDPFEWDKDPEQRSLGKNATRGLARVKAGKGSLIAYSTTPGATASDKTGGNGRNSPYTTQLLTMLDRPGWTLHDMFDEVGRKVAEATGDEQLPENTATVLPKNFCLAGCKPEPVADRDDQKPTIEPQPVVPPPPPPPDQPKTGEVIHDRLANGSPGPAMVFIGGGSFQMGSPAGETGRDSDERQHAVRVGDFYIGQTEVTFDEYDRYAKAKGLPSPGDEGWGRGQRPVINVSWEDATAYAAWLSEQTGQTYRLPTEAQWEYAARAGTQTAYWWGNSIGTANANCDGCGSRWDDRQTAPVGSFAANRWNLYDTAGNVWEWTCSAWDGEYGGAENECNNNAKTYAERGGGWNDTPARVRSANRNWYYPTNRFDKFGFRLSRTR